MTSEDLKINLYWNESGTKTGLSNMINSGQKILVNFYNPGPNGIYPIRLRVPPKSLKIVNQNNTLILGDIFCSK